jgi:hypothetical protein
MSTMKRVFIIAFLFLIPALARADDIWTYTGNSVSGESMGQNPLPPNPCGCALDGTITFASPMTGLTQTEQDVVAYSFTDGAYTFNQSNSTLGFSAFTVAGEPSFHAWFLEVSANGAVVFFSEKYDTYEATDAGIGGLYEQANPGIWTEVAPVGTPEPNTLILLGAGITALALTITLQKFRA